MNWGTLTAANGYSIGVHASSEDGGDWGMAYKNGQIFMQLDGYFYQNEGIYRVLDEHDRANTTWSNADTLDGVHNGDVTAQYFSAGKTLTQADTLNTLLSGVYSYINAYNPTGSVGNNCIFLGFRDSGRTDTLQIVGECNEKQLYYRIASNVGSDYEKWSSWKVVIDSDNIGSQSVSYASSAGNSSTLGGLSATDFLRHYNDSSLDANSATQGWHDVQNNIENAAHINHSALIYVTNVGTPFQLQIPDSSVDCIYKRYYQSGSWSSWFKINAGYADSAGSVAWDNVSGRPSSMPASDVYSWAKASSKPSYSWSEISDKPTIPTVGQINYLTSNADIYPQYGLNVLIKMPSSGGYVNLPSLSQSQSYTGTSGSQKFAYIIRLACHTSGSAFTLYGYRGTYATTQYPHIRSGSTADRTTGVNFSAGDTDTYMLTYDGSVYEAYRLCYTE